MWKDYFYLTKREQKSVWVLTILVLILQVGIWTSDLWLTPIARLIKSESKQRLATATSPTQSSPSESFSNTTTEGKRNASKPVLRAFNPNTADSVQLKSLGLKPKIVRNILKYRSKGGQFRKPDDLAKIYGLDAESFNRLKPYIRLVATTSTSENTFNRREAGNTDQHSADQLAAYQRTAGSREAELRAVYQSTVLDTKNTTQSNINAESGSPVNATRPLSASSEPMALAVEAPPAIRQSQPSSQGNQFELNQADTATLKLLKGVGAVTADRIVRYRQQLGGFYDVRQLNEIKGLYPTVLETLTKTVSVNPEKITKININKASLEKLKAHPYLDFYQAKVIVELRKNRKTIRSLTELSTFTEFTPTDLERLRWYLEP